MSVRLGQFYAFMLLLACLATNVAFFSEVREHFVGDVDPLSSVKTVFSEWKNRESIADFCTQVQSSVGGVDSSALPKEGNPTLKERYRQPTSSPAEPEKVAPITGSFTQSVPQPVPTSVSPPEVELEKDARQEEPRHTPAIVTPAKPHQTASVIPVPQMSTAKPVIADQFKPVTADSKPMESAKSAKPSSTTVWETVGTVLERPLRYD